MPLSGLQLPHLVFIGRTPHFWGRTPMRADSAPMRGAANFRSSAFIHCPTHRRSCSELQFMGAFNRSLLLLCREIR